MLVYDSFTIYFRTILLFFAVLFVVFTKLSGIPDREDAADFYTLVLGGMVGMCLMATANHLVIIFLGVEMASVPSYALAGMLKSRPRSSEAALKYAVYGAGAAGIMLYGISLLAGVLGTCHSADDGRAAGRWNCHRCALSNRYMVLALGGLMIGVGLAFKLSAFPFHFWCPDVFEGATAEVNAFLSVASKAAALALLVRVAVGFTTLPAKSDSAALPGGIAAVSAADAAARQTFRLASMANRCAAEGKDLLAPVRRYITLLVCADRRRHLHVRQSGRVRADEYQTADGVFHDRARRLHHDADRGRHCAIGQQSRGGAIRLCAVPFYVGLYLFMNLGAFAIIAFLRNTTRSEEIADWGGLVRISPGVVVCLAIVLFSLVGMPPLAGFSAKYVAFASLVRGDGSAGLSRRDDHAVGGRRAEHGLSLFYYLRVVKTMAIDPEPTHRPTTGFSLVSLPGAFVVAVTLPILILGLFWDQFYTLARPLGVGKFAVNEVRHRIAWPETESPMPR